jgi:DNA-binding NarL/FixJ family response regulator
MSGQESRKSRSAAILAGHHRDFLDGLRGLLESAVQTVYVVSDYASLLEGARRLRPVIIVMDFSFAARDFPQLIRDIADDSPTSRVIVLTTHDEASTTQLTLDAGVAGVVLKRCAGRDFQSAVDAVLRGEVFVSSDITRNGTQVSR